MIQTSYKHTIHSDCGVPPSLPGASYGQFLDTRYQSTFGFGCKDDAFRLTGQSSKDSNIVTCQDDGTWDFGTLRCEGPVCEDPGRPADGEQISDSYEQGSKVSFTCNKPGYIPINPQPIEVSKYFQIPSTLNHRFLS